MYRTFKSQLKSSLKEFFENRGFVQVKDDTFISIKGDLFFLIRVGKAGYGSRIELQYLVEVPLVKVDFDEQIQHMSILDYTGESISCSNWKIDEKGLKAEEKRKKVMEYVSEIEHIYDNYLFYIFSKEVNQFDMEVYIKKEYEDRFAQYLSDKGEEDPCWQYKIDFVSSGRSMDEWTQEDSEQCSRLVEEKKNREYPYELVRTQVLKDIEANRSVYRDVLRQLNKGSNKELIVDNGVLPKTLDVLYSNSPIQSVLEEYGFVLDIDRDSDGRANYGETYYYKSNFYECELSVILSDELFLYFSVSCGESFRRVCKCYDKFFWFGWLVGNEDIMKKNIELALDELKKTLIDLNVNKTLGQAINQNKRNEKGTAS